MPKTTIDLSVDRVQKIEEIQAQLNMEYFKDALVHVIDLGLDKSPFLSKDLTEKLGKIFLEASPIEKLNIVVDSFLKWHEKFPYLNIQREITPEDAGFLPLECVKPIYWENKFLGFQCIIKQCPIDLPHISFKDSSGHHITLKVTTPELCATCVGLSKTAKRGIDLFQGITLEQVKLNKEKLKKPSRTEKEQIIMQKLQGKFRESTIEKALKIFNYVTYDAYVTSDPNTEKWKWRGVDKASKRLGLSRMTIYEILKELSPDAVIS